MVSAASSPDRRISRRARFRGWPIASFALLGASVIGHSARAADGSWNTTSGNWATPASWTGGVIPGSTASTVSPDTATFTTANSTVTVDANRNIANIIFAGPTAGAFTFSGGNLLFSAGGQALLDPSLTGTARTQVFNSPITLTGDYSLTNNATSAYSYTIGSSITSAAVSGTTNLNYGGSNTTAATISGVISNGRLANVVAVNKNGGATLTLAGANSFSGGLNINAGTVRLITSTAATGLGAVSISPGAVLDMTSTSPIVYGLNGTGAVANTGALRTLNLAGSGSYNFSGAIAPTTPANLAVTVVNTGVQTLSGANSFTGATTLSYGQLRLDLSTLATPTTNVINSGSNISFGGATGSNTLTIVPGTASGTAYSQTLSTTTNGVSFTSGNFGSGATHINLEAPAGGGSTLTVNLGQITPASAAGATRTNGSTLDLRIPAGTAVFTTAGSTLNAAQATFTTFITINGTDFASKNTTTNQVIPFANYQTAAVTTLGAGGGSNPVIDINLATDTTTNASATIGGLRFNGAASRTLTQQGAANLLTLGGGSIAGAGILVTPNVGANTSTITGGIIAGASSRDLVISQNNTSGNLVVGSTITSINANTLVLTKSGLGNLILSGTNTHGSATTGTILNEGTITVASDPLTGNSQTLTTTTGSNQVSGVDTTGLFIGQRVTGSNVYGTNTTGLYISGINPAANTITLSSAISATTSTPGTAVVTFNGGSALGFAPGGVGGDIVIGRTAGNLVNGILSVPTLQIGNNGNTGSLFAGQAVVNNGLVAFNRADTALQFSNVISGLGGVSQIGTGTVTLIGANTYTGVTSINSGILALGLSNTVPAVSTMSLGGGQLALNGTSSLNGTRTGMLTLVASSSIDFGTMGTAQTLNFADSSFQNWGGNVLTITNYEAGLDMINFGSVSGLTPSQLAGISFVGAAFGPGAQIDSFGNVTPNAVPVPEPTAWIAIVAGAGMMTLLRKRRDSRATAHAKFRSAYQTVL